MRRGVVVLALMGLAMLPSPAVAAFKPWTPANKDGFGTAKTRASKVWFTLGGGELNEVYYPDLGTPAIHDLQLVVDGKPETTTTTSRTELVDARSLTYRQVGTGDGYTIEKTYVTDPKRNTLLIDVQLSSPHDVKVRLEPSSELKGQVAMIRSGADQHFTIALGFAPRRSAALRSAQASLDEGFGPIADQYASGWHSYLAGLPAAPASAAAQQPLYDVSVMTLAAHEDKAHPGAYVASPSMPWAFGSGLEKPSGPYHLVWARDLYQIATGLLAAGDHAGAERALNFLLKRQQKPDGSFPQNSDVTGKPHWTSLQMDEVGLPIVLAAQLGREQDFETWLHVRAAADFIVRRGPISKQERWENQSGYSPGTIAAEIAGLVEAARFADRFGDGARAARYRRVADFWQANVQRWTATTNGPYASGPVYLRLTKHRDPDTGTTYTLGDGGPAKIDQREVVDPSFLELVRLGVKKPGDPAIVNSIGVVDRVLSVQTPNGQFWHRYTQDGYGERANGAAWLISKDGSGKTRGRAWPIFAGERGEYELLAGQPAQARLDAMAATANNGYMLPEQVWDGAPPTGPAFPASEGTTSATPLAWTHAQYLRLARSIDAGVPVELPVDVACRYATCPR